MPKIEPLHRQNTAVWPSIRTPELQYLDARIRCGDLDEARSFVRNLTSERRQELTKDSNLMGVALRENKPEFIRFLVEECSTDFEKYVDKPLWDAEAFCLLSSIKLFASVGDTSITPLRYAARFNKTEAAVDLMRLGATVNAASPNSRLTAMHDACTNGTLVIVRHLIQHGADLTMKDDRGKTALMYGLDHVDVCRELLDRGTDVNATDNDGNTALHNAINASPSKKPEVVKLLLDSGADFFKKNDDGEDAHYLACKDRTVYIIKFMRDKLSDDEEGHKALIESHQLLGACYIIYKDPLGLLSHVDKALAEWETVIRLREERRHVITVKDDVVSTQNSAYDNAVEVDSMLKFNEMRQDVNKICMQGLLLIEKILGPTHCQTIKSVIRLAEFYFKSEDYGRGLRLLRHGIRISRDHRISSFMSNYYVTHLWNDSVRHIEINMRIINDTVGFSDVYEFLETITVETRRLRESTIEDSSLMTVREIFMQITVFLVMLFAYINVNEVNIFQFRKLLHEFVQLKVKTSQGRTILMKAICPENFDRLAPGFRAIKLLLECGADTSETDNNGNSVLHLLEKSEQWILRASGKFANKEAIKMVAEMLLTFGAHFDARNSEGLTVVDYLSSLGLEFSTHMTLQCLAAQAIRRHKIPYAGILPKSLMDFVQMH